MSGAVRVAMRPDDVMKAGAFLERGVAFASCQVKAPFMVALALYLLCFHASTWGGSLQTHFL